VIEVSSLIDLEEKVFSTPCLRMETEPVSEMLCCLQYWMTDKVQKPSIPKKNPVIQKLGITCEDSNAISLSTTKINIHIYQVEKKTLDDKNDVFIDLNETQ
jgi:hypothetical protein